MKLRIIVWIGNLIVEDWNAVESARARMSNRQPSSNVELETVQSKNAFVDLLYDNTALAMTTRVGSYAYRRFDACLAVVEKTAKWSLPQTLPSEEDTNKINISAPPLIRPLPWIFFLPALIALRLIRAFLSFVALLVGKQPVYPSTLVSFLQSRRRKLRALKHVGQKLQRIKQAERQAEDNDETQISWLQRIALPLRHIVCLKAVRRGSLSQQEDSSEIKDDATGKDGSSRAKPRDEEQAGCRKRNATERDADDSEGSFEEPTVQELLEKYCNDEGDSSYHPSESVSSESDSYVSESDKSLTETTDPAKRNGPKKVKKETNGHTTPPAKAVAASLEKAGEELAGRLKDIVSVENITFEAASVQKLLDKYTNQKGKLDEQFEKSSLNAAENNDNPKPSAPAEPIAENGNSQSRKEPNAPQKPVKTATDTSASADSKTANQGNSAKDQPSTDGHKNTNTNPPNKPQSNQNQHNQQQQNQSTAVNGGGGGGRKQKKQHH